MDVPPTGSGYSAEPEPISVVSAVPVSIPNAEVCEITQGLLDMAHRDNAKLREAGFELALAATRVVRDYDGLHRLSIALSGWFKAVADQGDRGQARSGAA